MSKEGKPSVGFLGLGAMGTGLATNLHAHLKEQGQALRVWNRTKSKAQALLDDGAELLESPSEAAQTCQVVFSSLYDDAAVLNAIGEYLDAEPAAGSVLVECSTINPETTKGLAARAEAAGVHYIASPVFGRPDAAAQRKVLFCVAGAEEPKQRVRAFMDNLGRGVLDVGLNPHLANVMKLTGNFFIASCIETLAEGMALAEKNGVSREVVKNFVSSTFPGPIYPGYAQRIADAKFDITPETPGFPVEGGLKDIGLMRKVAEATGVRLPLADVMYQNMESAQERGYGKLDWGAVACVLREEAGLPE